MQLRRRLLHLHQCGWQRCRGRPTPERGWQLHLQRRLCSLRHSPPVLHQHQTQCLKRRTCGGHAQVLQAAACAAVSLLSPLPRDHLPHWESQTCSPRLTGCCRRDLWRAVAATAVAVLQLLHADDWATAPGCADRPPLPRRRCLSQTTGLEPLQRARMGRRMES